MKYGVGAGVVTAGPMGIAEVVVVVMILLHLLNTGRVVTC